MSKAEVTKAHIVRQAAELFNLKGYAGASMADIMQATGLKKGGIYNHFASKEDLAIAAFDRAVALVSQKVWQAIKTKRNALERLDALVCTYLIHINEPPIAGGCPILNTAVEMDDTNSPLRDRTLAAMNKWRSLIVRIVQKGIKKGEVNPKTDPDLVATLIISNIEGALMMTKLERNPVHLQRAITHLQTYIQQLAV